jgi:hypothetical protein
MSNVLFAGLLRLFGRAFEPLGREFGLGESIILRDMKPVYWPIWRVDLVAEGMVGPAKGGPEHEAWLGVPEGYIPGEHE